MLEITQYNSGFKTQWDDLVSIARNSTFLFYRDYMDYHSDRFNDCSYLIYRKGKLEAIIPGNLSANSFFSHQGLTYGGLVSSNKIGTVDVLEIFKLLITELKRKGINEVIYKPVPIIYHTIPAQEDIYAMFLLKAKKIGCNISSTILQNNKLRFIESRRSGIRKSIKVGVNIVESNNYTAFWEIIEKNLIEKFNTKPVHSLQEIKLLKARFPENIKLYVAKYEGTIVAGTIVYIMKNIVHVQYISANRLGKELGALDLLFERLIQLEFQHIPIFDFGQSTENSGNYLNENLIFQKEGFGGRGVVYETYQLKI